MRFVCLRYRCLDSPAQSVVQKAVCPSCFSRNASDEFLPIVDSQVLGVVRLVVQSGSFPKSRLRPLATPPNPFVKIATDVEQKSFCTSCCRRTYVRTRQLNPVYESMDRYNPNWMKDTLSIPVSSTDSGIHLSVRSRSRYRWWTSIGSSFLSLDHILDTPDLHSVTLPLSSSKGKPRGHLLVSVSFNPAQTVDHPSGEI